MLISLIALVSFKEGHEEVLSKHTTGINMSCQ